MTPADGLTRRGLLGGAASLGIGAGLGYVTKGLSDDDGETPASVGETTGPVEFHGTYQAGIATPAPEFLSFAAFDLTAGSANDLRSVLQDWTAAAVSLTQG